jgi:hypothetical protein
LGAFDDVIKLIQNNESQQAQEKLFNIYNNNLQKAVTGVFDKATRSKYKDYYSFQANAAKFSAYKSNYVLRTLLKASENDPANFENTAKYILKTFNRYQVTEYNTTLSRCRTARQFHNFKQTQGLYPNLEWLRTRSATPRELHLSYVGIILPLNHSFWKENQPGNLYGCKCDWRRTQAAPTEEPKKIILPANGLNGNPAITREIFSDKHPYFSKAKDADSIDKFISDWIYKNQFNKIEGENNNPPFFVHPLLNKEASDYKDLFEIIKQFSKMGTIAYMTPTANAKSDLYHYLYKKKGAYKNKCPDLFVDGAFIEYESFEGIYNENTLGNMLSNGLKQSDKIIIDQRGSSDNVRYAIKRIQDRVANGQKIKEVWILKEGNILERIF